MLVLMEEELVGVCWYDFPLLIAAMIHTGGTGEPAWRSRVCCWLGGVRRGGGVTTPWNSRRATAGTGRTGVGGKRKMRARENRGWRRCVLVAGERRGWSVGQRSS